MVNPRLCPMACHSNCCNAALMDKTVSVSVCGYGTFNTPQNYRGHTTEQIQINSEKVCIIVCETSEQPSKGDIRGQKVRSFQRHTEMLTPPFSHISQPLCCFVLFTFLLLPLYPFAHLSLIPVTASITPPLSLLLINIFLLSSHSSSFSHSFLPFTWT